MQQLISRDQLHSLLCVISDDLNRLEDSLCDSHAVENVATYLRIFLEARNPKKWKGAHRPHAADPSRGPALESFARHIFRGVSDSVNTSLLNWHSGKYKLQLFTRIPSSEEVLTLQIRGERCVTLLFGDDLFLYPDERDPLSFCIHDLVHAHHFFSQDDRKAAQLGFYRLCLELNTRGWLQELLKRDPIFCKEWEYGYADMNSHGVHLSKYLKAILSHSFQRTTGDKDAAFAEIAELLNTSAWHELNSQSESIEAHRNIDESLKAFRLQIS